MRIKFPTKAKNILKKVWSSFLKINPIFYLLLFMIPLRLINLGYSEYICDESVALSYLKTNGRFYSSDFLLSQHKGPMQYFVNGIVFFLNKDLMNEFIFRIPFALINILSIGIFYLFLKNITKSRAAAFFSSFLLGINGMVLAFGRIVQYQSLNLFFSFLSLYFFSKISLEDNPLEEKVVVRNSVLGTVFFSISLLSHWDAVFILPYLIYVVTQKVILNKKFTKKFKLHFIFANLLVLLLLCLLYLFPYLKHFINSFENQQYLRNRVRPGLVSKDKFLDRAKFYLFRLKLYNPFLYLELLLGIIISSFFYLKKNWVYLLWLIVEFIFFIYIFTNPGTHIYNLFIPVIVISAFQFKLVIELISSIKKKFSKIFIIVFTFLSVLISVFYYYQSYILFVDNKVEYPWRSKNVLDFKAGNFSRQQISTYMNNNKIGFSLRRGWEDIEKIMSDYEKNNGYLVGSTKVQTNENLCPMMFYSGREATDFGYRFIVAVKYPLSLVNDYKGFSRESNKKLIGSVKNKYQETTAFVYVTR